MVASREMNSPNGRSPRLLRAAEVPPLMDPEYDGRGGWVALAQFAQHWNHNPEHREWMKSTPLPDTADPRRGALVAALVHALCIRDGSSVPDWVLGWCHPTAVWASAFGVDADSPLGRSVRAQCPAVCDYHRAYFEVSFRDRQ